jgi:hypothetical protein
MRKMLVETRWAAFVALVAIMLAAPDARAQGRARAAAEAAEFLIARFGASAGRSASALARRIEGLAARYGEEAIIAARKGGPAAVGLVEAAGPDGARAVRVLLQHGEKGAARVLSRPTAMKQYLRFGDEAAAVLVKHPGVAEPLLNRGGAQAVKALGSVTPRSGRRLAMLLDGELAQAGRHPELLGVIAKHGDRAIDFLWQNKGVLAGGAALTAFLVNPEPYLNGARDLAEVAGESVVKPTVQGLFTTVYLVLGVVGLLIVAGAVLSWKYGLPRPEQIKELRSALKR